MDGAVDQVSEFFRNEVQFDLLTGIGSSVVLTLLAVLFKPVRMWLRHRANDLREFFRARTRLTTLINSVEGDGVWKAQQVRPPEKYAEFFHSGKPILTVANLKGGVGKTTISANLGAYFAKEKQENILLIDLDFQGSLSAMLLTPAACVPPAKSLSKAAQIVEGGVSLSWLVAAAERIKQFPTALAIPAYYDLARVENKAMVHWLARHRTDDIRYSLAKLLHHPDLPYSRVIIDAPPRMTTGLVQALAASTHVLIPTVLDGASGAAVGTFVETIESHRSIWPYLKYVGVCGSLTYADLGAARESYPDRDIQDSMLVAERAGERAVLDAIARVSKDRKTSSPITTFLPHDTFIARKANIAVASGEAVAYDLIKEDERAMFRRLGAEVAMRMKR